MESVPKPAYLEIILPGERHLARSTPDDLFVLVWIRWRRAENVPPILRKPADMPELPNARDFEILRREDGRYTLIPKRWQPRGPRFGKGPTFYELERAGQDMGWGKSLEYVGNLIKYHQPDFDYAASEDNADFLLRTLKRLNAIERSNDALRNHLQYSGPAKKKAQAPVENPERDVRAAILSDVMGLSSLDIRKKLGLKRKWKRPQAPSTGANVKREDPTTRFAIQRGRALLQHFYGAEEWHRKIARMRAKRAEWLDLGDRPKAQMYYLLAEVRGTSMEEEERKALQEGFDEQVGAWIAAWERDDRQAAEKIEAADPRFEVALRQL
jgi:hypothetical protein